MLKNRIEIRSRSRSYFIAFNWQLFDGKTFNKTHIINDSYWVFKYVCHAEKCLLRTVVDYNKDEKKKKILNIIIDWVWYKKRIFSWRFWWSPVILYDTRPVNPARRESKEDDRPQRCCRDLNTRTVLATRTRIKYPKPTRSYYREEKNMEKCGISILSSNLDTQ